MMSITYWRWEKLPEKSQSNYIKVGMLPFVQWADMENDNLLSSQMTIVDGERCWEIRYKGGKKTHIFPEYKEQNVLGISMRCKFDPTTGRYNAPSVETKIGYYGMLWVDFMKENYPKIYRELEKGKTLYAVAQSVNKTAWEYKELLDRQYEQAHPRPCEWEDEKAHSSWKFTRNFYTDHEVMVDKVLIKRTAV